jgi:hypothetical protein
MKGFTRTENEDLAIRFESKFPRKRLNKATLAQWIQVVSDAETLVRIAVTLGDVGLRLAVRVAAEAMDRAPQGKMSQSGRAAIRHWLYGSIPEEALKTALRAAVVAHETADAALDRALQLNRDTKMLDREVTAAEIPVNILGGILNEWPRGLALRDALRNARMACDSRDAGDAEKAKQRADFLRFMAEL